jgi:hypothetical protein
MPKSAHRPPTAKRPRETRSPGSPPPLGGAGGAGFRPSGGDLVASGHAPHPTSPRSRTMAAVWEVCGVCARDVRPDGMRDRGITWPRRPNGEDRRDCRFATRCPNSGDRRGLLFRSTMPRMAKTFGVAVCDANLSPGWGRCDRVPDQPAEVSAPRVPRGLPAACRCWAKSGRRRTPEAGGLTESG